MTIATCPNCRERVTITVQDDHFTCPNCEVCFWVYQDDQGKMKAARGDDYLNAQGAVPAEATPLITSSKDVLSRLSCSACGGVLTSKKGSDLLVCQYCSTEYILHKENNGGVSLEAFARCPICKRNDKVEKVSAIHTNQTEVNRTGRPVSMSPLARRLSPPVFEPTVTLAEPAPLQIIQEKPLPAVTGSEKTGRGFTITGVVILGVLFLLFFVIFFQMVQDNPSGKYSEASSFFASICTASLCSSLISIPLPAILLALGRIKRSKVKTNRERLAVEEENEKIRRRNQRNLDRYREEMAAYRSNLEAEKAGQTAWEQSYQNWKKLYYCHRDDVVFLPGKNTFSDANNMQHYISQE